MNESEIRLNASLAELQFQITALLQRCVNYSGDLAVANAKIKELEGQLKEKVDGTETGV